MKKRLLISVVLIATLAATSSVAWAGGKARRPAIVAGADRVVELQRTDAGWAGTWYWYVGYDYDATNLTGVTALGLLEAYRDTKDTAYLDAAKSAASFIMMHLGTGATETQHHERATAADIVFLHRLGQVTGDASYSTRATEEWNHLTSYWSTAGDLDALFRSIDRRLAWDIAFFMEAAHLSGDTVWADGAAAILANTGDDFYYGDTEWYALNVAGAIRALAGCGYGEQYSEELSELLGALVGLTDDDNGIDGYVQDTAYAILAFQTVGGGGQKYANSLGRWLASQQEDNGGWLEVGTEYAEIDGEAVRAMATTIGTDVTIDGFQEGTDANSSWVKDASAKRAVPFNGE